MAISHSPNGQTTERNDLGSPDSFRNLWSDITHKYLITQTSYEQQNPKQNTH